ncbi:MAG: TorF family putative porin [Pseudomonadota bacterium]
MKLIKYTGLAVLLAGSAFTAQNAMAVEISANAGVASAYLWRGQNLSNGSAAISADVTASQNGAYATMWTSSGDDAAGQEYDLIVGYGGEAGKVSYDVSAVTYIYPQDNTDFGDLSDLVVSVGYGPATLTHYDNIAGGSGTGYTTLSGDVGKVTALVGVTNGQDNANYSHLDVTYNYNDRLSFTASKVVDKDDDAMDDSTNVVAAYSLPLK